MKFRIKYGAVSHTISDIDGDQSFRDLDSAIRRQFGIAANETIQLVAGYPPQTLDFNIEEKINSKLKKNCVIMLRTKAGYGASPVKTRSSASTLPSRSHQTTQPPSDSSTTRPQSSHSHNRLHSGYVSRYGQATRGHTATADDDDGYLELPDQRQGKVLRRGKFSVASRKKKNLTTFHQMRPSKRARHRNPFGNRKNRPVRPLTEAERTARRVAARERRLLAKTKRAGKQIVRAKLDDATQKSDGTGELKAQVGLLQMMAQSSMAASEGRKLAEHRFKSAFAQVC